MLYFAHFLFFLSIGTGFVALYISLQIYRRYKHNYLISNILMLAGFNVITLANTIEAFIKISFPNILDSNILNLYFSVILFILPLVIIFSVYHFTVLLQSIIGRKVLRIYKIIAIIAAIAFILSQLIYYSGLFEIIELKYIAIIIANAVLFIVIIGNLINTLVILKQIKPRRKRKAIRFFVIALLSFITGLLSFAILGSLSIISLNTQMLLVSLIVFVFNIIIVIFIKAFFENFHADLNISKNSFVELIKEFQISIREKEIVLLICKGKTNKEIGAELFISPLTVRDHISNIFRKTDVKNRTQLASMFQLSSEW